MRVRDIVSWLDSVAPFDYAEPWDNVGLQIGDPDGDVKRVLFALDPTSSSLAEAVNLNCECLITHHPLFLEGVKNLRSDLYPQSLAIDFIRQRVNLIVAHTNLDAAKIGGNWLIAEALKLQDRKPLSVSQKFSQDSKYIGIGLFGELSQPVTVKNLCQQLKSCFEIERLNLVGDSLKIVKTIAVCTGSGGSLLGRVRDLGADCFITGELKYHDAVWAEESKLTVIALGHFGSERFMMAKIAQELQEWSKSAHEALEVFVFEQEMDHIAPFQSFDA